PKPSRTAASRRLGHALVYDTIESATAPTTSTRFSAKDDHANTAGTCDSRAQASSHCIVRFFAASSRLRVADATVAWRRPFALVLITPSHRRLDPRIDLHNGTESFTAWSTRW